MRTKNVKLFVETTRILLMMALGASVKAAQASTLFISLADFASRRIFMSSLKKG